MFGCNNSYIKKFSEDGNKWTTIGVSENILDASYDALHDSITYKLIKNSPN